MTNPRIKHTVKNDIGDSVIFVESFSGFLAIDWIRLSGARTANVKNDEVRKLRDVLDEYLASQPKPPTAFEEDWAKMPIGSKFGFASSDAGYGTQRGEKTAGVARYYPYVKAGKTYYTNVDNTYKQNLVDLAESDHARGAYWEKPEPSKTFQQQFGELPDDTVFKIVNGGYGGTWRKINHTQLYGMVNRAIMKASEIRFMAGVEKV